MPRRELPPPHSVTQQGLCPVFLDYSVDLFDVYSGIMGDITAARYREGVMGESHEATERLANPKTLIFISSARSLDHNPYCLVSPGVGPLESALVTSLICLASITQLLDAN